MKNSLRISRNLKEDVVYVLKEALVALNSAPNFRIRGLSTTSYDVAAHIQRVLHRLRSPATPVERHKGAVP